MDWAIYFSLVALILACISNYFTFLHFRINVKPSLSIENILIKFEKNNNFTLDQKTMYNSQHMQYNLRDKIESMVVTFTLHNTSSYTIYNMRLNYCYSTNKITEYDLIRQEPEYITLAANKSERFVKKHQMSFNKYDQNKHYIAILITSEKYNLKTKIFHRIKLVQKYSSNEQKEE